MKKVLPSALVGWFLNHARGLKHPQLFKWICAIFLVDLFVPDLLPFVDELLLGLAALYLGSRRKTQSSELPRSGTDGDKSHKGRRSFAKKSSRGDDERS
ncbi:DUF6116 family protein [Microbulbifer yueqingensis]|uniref:Uncharacterized protein n=1 Tax=Microbulbifer yueqingensis TaxID=658219 RepID=A0A1G9E7C4_9GAMM|nr:DUF6116 family protein [Microbulbifer yueqingensis]SDK72044.1 hypothetical protein SAMN05216212_3051 [Microbulbifer yueqingensis]